MSSDLANIFVLSLVAMANPTLLAATTAMMLLPNPRRLMLGYLLGAYTTSIISGVLIVHALNHSKAVSTAKHSIHPVVNIVLGVLCLAIVYVVQTGRARPFQERRRAKKEAKLKAKREAGKPTESLSMRLLGRGNAWLTFVVGAIVSFPGATFIDAMDHIHKLHPGNVASLLLIVYFCVFQQIILEVPFVGFLFAPESTQALVNRFKAWVGRKGQTIGVIAAIAIGALLILRGLLSIG
ncbi:MAG: GAP family protein [Solirubrobacteraceae bacterium]